MKNYIKFKPALLSRNTYIMAFVVVLLSATLFMEINLPANDIYSMSLILATAGVVIIFYLNRFEPDHIEIEDDKVNIYYINKMIFKRKDTILQKDNLTVLNRTKDSIGLYNNDTLVAIVRLNAVDPKDWNTLKEDAWLR